MKTVNPADKLEYTVAETAAMLGIGLPAAYDLVHHGDFLKLKVGCWFIIPKQALERWLNGQQEGDI